MANTANAAGSARMPTAAALSASMFAGNSILYQLIDRDLVPRDSRRCGERGGTHPACARRSDAPAYVRDLDFRTRLADGTLISRCAIGGVQPLVDCREIRGSYDVFDIIEGPHYVSARTPTCLYSRSERELFIRQCSLDRRPRTVRPDVQVLHALGGEVSDDPKQSDEPYAAYPSRPLPRAVCR